MKNKDNKNDYPEKNKKDSNEYLEKDNNVFTLKVEDEPSEEDISYLNLGELFDKTFKYSQKEYTKDNNSSVDSTVNLNRLSENNQMKETATLNPKFSNHIEKFDNPNENSINNQKRNINNDSIDNFVHKNDFDSNYRKKNKELKEKIVEYNDRYRVLEKRITEYEEKTSELIQKREEYDGSIKNYEDKNRLLDERNEEISIQIRKLQEAREKIMELSKQIEEKKIDLGKRESNLKKTEKDLEKIKFDLEKSKLEFEKNKLEFEIGKSNLESEIGESDIASILRKGEETKQPIERERKRKSGKGEILQDLMLNLSQTGNFKSCFLIDGKGMLISEYSQVQLDPIAIGAMFSLIYTAILRAIKILNLYELEYFKISSINGEFILKNINILNYERNFILLAYYDDSNSTLPDSKQILDKKIIKKILKNVKKDFYELGTGSKSSSIFENLNDRINFLKKKYTIPHEELEIARVHLLNETSVKIKDLFEK
ncbi:MAG: hypothetical protein ACFFEN_15575 [Candidatus Thorarchaeota archaeon]